MRAPDSGRAHLGAPEDGERRLAACAGAGGKTLALAALGPGARLVGCDVRTSASLPHVSNLSLYILII